MTETQCKRNWLVIVNSSCSVGSDPHFPAGSLVVVLRHPIGAGVLAGIPMGRVQQNESGVQRKDG